MSPGARTVLPLSFNLLKLSGVFLWQYLQWLLLSFEFLCFKPFQPLNLFVTFGIKGVLFAKIFNRGAAQIIHVGR